MDGPTKAEGKSKLHKMLQLVGHSEYAKNATNLQNKYKDVSKIVTHLPEKFYDVRASLAVLGLDSRSFYKRFNLTKNV